MSDSNLEGSGKGTLEDGKEINKPDEQEGGENYIPNPDIKDKVIPPDDPEIVELKEEDVLSFLTQKTGREIKSFEDLTIEKTVEVQADFANEQIASINKYVAETGRSVDDWHKTQSIDFSKYSSEQLLKEDLKSKFPKLTSVQIDSYFNETYKLDPEAFEANEVTVGQVKLEMDAKKILDQAIKLQNDFRVPVKKAEEPIKVEPTIATKTETPIVKNDEIKGKKVWVEDMKQTVEQLEIINIGEFEVKVDEEMKSGLIEANSNLESFFEDNFVKDGKWDYQKLSRIMFLAKEDNLNSVIGSIKSNLVAEGQEKVIENRKNLNLPGIGVKKPKNLTPEQIEELDNFEKALSNSVSE